MILKCAIPLTESTELYKYDLFGKADKRSHHSSSLNVILLLYMLQLVRSTSNVGKVPTPVYFIHILASHLLCHKIKPSSPPSLNFFYHILMAGYFPTV